jgi:hemerythrin superfamily protein
MPVEQSRTRSDGNVVDQILRDHDTIRAIVAQFDATPAGTRRQDLWRNLLRTLTAHEAAEDDIVYPRVRSAIPDGDALVQTLRQEREMGRSLTMLEDADLDGALFESDLHNVITAVLEHIAHEEQDVWPRLLDVETPETLRRLGAAFRIAKQDELRSSMRWV